MEVFKPEQTDPMQIIVTSRLEELGIKPSENLGQHFLINGAYIDQIAKFVIPGNNVIEIGVGTGQLTEAMASQANQVTAIEIDKRYEPILSQIEEAHPNVAVIYGDALTLRWEKYFARGKGQTNTQLISNLPYHISEPFFRKLAKLSLSFEDVILMLGKRLVSEIRATSEDSVDFGTISLIAQTFFNIDYITTIHRSCFYPVPGTDSGLVRLLPKSTREAEITRRDHVFRKLFLTEDRNPTVGSILKDALVEYEQSGQKGTLSKSEYARKNRRMAIMNLKAVAEEYNYTRLKAKNDTTSDPHANLLSTQHLALKRVNSMGIPETILAKPFRQLDNGELKLLSKALGQ